MLQDCNETLKIKEKEGLTLAMDYQAKILLF